MEPVDASGKKIVKPLIIVFIVIVFLVLAIGGTYYYFRDKKRAEEGALPTPTPTEAPQKGEIGYQEPVTTVAIGTEGVSKGTFVKVEAGSIYFTSEGAEKRLPLTVDEVVLSCTNQGLAAATELDFNQVVSVHRMTPATIGARIPANEAVVVFAADVSGVLRAHTVAIAASACSQ